jgi:hypothetical protein
LLKKLQNFTKTKKDLAETKVKLVKEAKTKFAELKKMFVESSANKVSDIVAKTLTKEISQLKEDIEDARKNDFGRKLFEAFASEYATSHLNEKSETAKLMKVVDLKNKQLEEAKVAMAKTIKLAESKDAQIGQMKATAERKDIMNNLIDPLSKDQKEIMSELLESVQTNRLQSAFDKYLPAVIDGKTPAKKATLTEGKEVTGNRDTVSQTNVSSNADDNLIEFKRLAGLN